MRRFLFYAFFIGVFASCQSPTGTAYNNAAVIYIQTGNIQKLNFLVQDGIITQVSETPLQGNTTIDLEGRYVIPPFSDMHVHLHGNHKNIQALKKHGVFQVRDMGVFKENHIDSLYQWNEKGVLNIHSAGFIHSGDCYEDHKNIKTKEDVINAVNYNVSKQLPYFKVHNCFPYKLFPILDSLARVQKLKIVGHIPEGYDALDYIKTGGVSSIEHTDIFVRSLSYREEAPATSILEAVQILDGSYLDSLATALQENHVALTPTLVTYENYVAHLPKEQQGIGNNLFKRIQSYTKRMYEHGVLLLPASDLGVEGIEAGASLLRELELLKETGLSPLQVLQIAIVNPAVYLEKETPGIVQGQPASFLVLEKNPLEDISNLKAIRSVVHKGTSIE